MPTRKTDKPDEVKVSTLQVGQLAAMLEALAADIKTQIVGQVNEQIQDVAGALQSDFASRFVAKDDIDIGLHERLRANAARGDAAFAFKTNVVDFLNALDATKAAQGQTSAYNRMIEASVNHYATSLADERVTKARLGYAHSAKIQQEQRHADLATEEQWESNNEVLTTVGLANRLVEAAIGEE